VQVQAQVLSHALLMLLPQPLELLPQMLLLPMLAPGT
jgi:hypothetical protein